MLQRADKGEVHELRENQRHDADLHRRPDVLPRIEPRGEDLDEDHADQTDAVGDQRAAGHPCVLGAEPAVMKQRRDQRHRDHCERGGRRDGEQYRHPQPPVQQARIFLAVRIGVVFRQAGKKDGAQRHAQHSRG